MTVTAGLFSTVALPAFALDQGDPATSGAEAAAAVAQLRRPQPPAEAGERLDHGVDEGIALGTRQAGREERHHRRVGVQLGEGRPVGVAPVPQPSRSVSNAAGGATTTGIAQLLIEPWMRSP